MACRRLLRADRGMVVWTFTEIEAASATWRLVRDGMLDRAQAALAARSLARLADGWSEVDGVDAVKARAERLLAVHSLRAADALQLAAALVWCEDRPSAGNSWRLTDNSSRQPGPKASTFSFRPDGAEAPAPTFGAARRTATSPTARGGVTIRR